MKKIALIAIALLVSLPSCKKDKNNQPTKKTKTEQRVNTMSPAGQEQYEDEDYEDLDEDLNTLFDFDEEAEEFVAINDDFDNEGMGKEALQELSWIDTQVDDELQPLYFEFNKHVLNDSQKKALNHDIEQVKQLIADGGESSNPLVVAEGHTCQEGTPEYNIGLSENRAKAVADALVAAGIDKDSIKIVGRGQENPLVEGKTRAERAPNRRVELRVIYT